MTTPSPEVVHTLSADHVDAIVAALRPHRRMLSPTGSGVRCECGHQYRDTEAWGRHLATLTAHALDLNTSPHPQP
jgi:acetone carboxylase gamma subunit